MQERLQKVMAARGLGSRRACERMIEEGRVRVNGKPATLGQKVAESDRIALDGKLLPSFEAEKQKPRVLIYNKPEGEVCTRHDPEGRRSVFTALPKIRQSRWISIGRLDITTTGLLLFTTDGELANRLMHPRYEIERKYAVRVLGQVDETIKQRLLKGVRLEDGMAKFLSLKDAGGSGANRWFHVTLAEGRNREVRRLWESQGLTVSRLMRIAYAGIELPRDLRAGKHQELKPKQLASLYKQVGLKEPVSSEDKPQRDARGSKKPRRGAENSPKGKRVIKPRGEAGDSPKVKRIVKPRGARGKGSK